MDFCENREKIATTREKSVKLAKIPQKTREKSRKSVENIVKFLKSRFERRFYVAKVLDARFVVLLLSSVISILLLCCCRLSPLFCCCVNIIVVVCHLCCCVVVVWVPLGAKPTKSTQQGAKATRSKGSMANGQLSVRLV